jgi:hypothetical protein
MLDLWLCDFCFHGWRRNSRSCLGKFIRCTHNEFVALHLRQRSGFSCGRQISRSLTLYSEPLNRPARVCAHNVNIRPVIIDHIVLNVDVGHVHRVSDVGDVLRWRKDPIPQDRFTDKTNVTEVVILRTDIELDIHPGANRLSFVNEARTARGQRRPANVIAAGPPRDPGRSPIQIAPRKPEPTVIGEICPATIMISGPAEIFVRNPRPTVIGISPVAVGVRPPVWIAYCHVGLPAIAVAFSLNPIPTGKIIVKEIDRYVVSSRLRKSRHNKSQHA